jgi:hypothetical protein
MKYFFQVEFEKLKHVSFYLGSNSLEKVLTF